MVRAELARQEEEVRRYNELAGQYNLLRQSRDSAQEAYSQIIRRIDELDISQLSGQGDNVFVVSKAEVPQIPSWPSRKKMLLIGLFLGIALCFFLDYMDTTIKNDTDVQTYLSASVLGAVPAIEREADEAPFDDLFALSSPRSHFAESFRTARTALAFTATDSPIQAFVVSSTLPSEGKSITSINLAIAYAQVGKKVLLVDADMRKPRLHDVFKAPARKIGLSNLLRADCTDEPASQIVSTSVEGLDLLPSGPLPPNPVELLDSARFSALLEKLRATYGIIIFDAPPSLDMVDSLVLAKRTDGIVLVTRAFSTNKYAARQVAQQVAASKARLLGVILNNVDMPTGAYSSYYSYYYSGRYYYGGSASSSSSSSKSQKPRSFFSRLFSSKDRHHKHHHHHSSSGSGSSSGTSA